MDLNSKKKAFKKFVQRKKLTFENDIIGKMHDTNNDPKRFWQLLEMLEKKTKTDYVPTITPSKWTNMFRKLLFDPGLTNFEIEKDDEEHVIMNKMITKEELLTATKKIKKSKASGLDQVLNEMILCTVDMYPEIFLNLFNSLLDNGIFPNLWTASIIVPLHKKGSKSDEKNYRGIALTSCLGKFFNLIVNERLTEFATSKNIVKPEQIGFVKGNRTSDNLLILHSLFNQYCNVKGKKLYAAFIDFEKAYDRISRDVLLKKLYSLGIRGKIFNVIESMYKNDQSCIQIGNKRTDFFPVNMGVKQGCILSPTLFNISLSDLPQVFNKAVNTPVQYGNVNVGSLFWADDIVILSETKEGLQ